MRTTRDAVIIDDVEWHVSLIAPMTPESRPLPIQGIEFRSGSTIRFLALDESSIPTRAQFADLNTLELEDLLARASEIVPTVLAQGRTTVLLVDDDDGVLRVIEQFCRRLGYDVISAPHGRAALGIARDHTVGFDVLITDVLMPGFSGLELLEALRAMYPALPAILMSGLSRREMREKGGMPPRTVLLQKPFTLQDMDRALRDCVDA